MTREAPISKSSYLNITSPNADIVRVLPYTVFEQMFEHRVGCAV